MFLILVLFNLSLLPKVLSALPRLAARFTLDAMPGKQMSIDADLNAGLINEIQARERRQKD